MTALLVASLDVAHLVNANSCAWSAVFVTQQISRGAPGAPARAMLSHSAQPQARTRPPVTQESRLLALVSLGWRLAASSLATCGYVNISLLHVQGNLLVTFVYRAHL